VLVVEPVTQLKHLALSARKCPEDLVERLLAHRKLRFLGPQVFSILRTQRTSLAAFAERSTTFPGAGLAARWVADHLLPGMFGGSDDISNLAAAHQSCNGRRGGRLLA
jgi:hypothetical protein